jgi:hypothetical protein
MREGANVRGRIGGTDRNKHSKCVCVCVGGGGGG